MALASMESASAAAASPILSLIHILAIGVIIGGAFQAIVSSLVGDIVSPLLGLIAKEDFSSWVWTIGGVEIKYGSFLTAVINFILMALVIFLFLRGLNKLLSLGKKAEARCV